MEATVDDTSFDLMFTSFVTTHTARLFKSAFLMTGHPTDAEDLLQDTLAHLYPRWHLVVAADSEIGYVIRSMSNRFISNRRSWRGRDLRLADVPEWPDERTSRVPAVVDRDELWRLMHILPPRQRAALVLRYFHDLSDDDIAQSLGCRTVTVRSLVSRGLAALRAAQMASNSDSTKTLGGDS